MISAETERRFWAKVALVGNVCECWEWTAGLMHGYGTFHLGRVAGTTTHTTGSHRVAWELTQGPIPEGVSILHHCDNPLCVNPEHLFLGTKGDNNRDRHAKGRTVIPDNRGERHGMAKLDWSKVRSIRTRLAAGERQKALAVEYGVDQSVISTINTGKAWVEL